MSSVNSYINLYNKITKTMDDELLRLNNLMLIKTDNTLNYKKYINYIDITNNLSFLIVLENYIVHVLYYLDNFLLFHDDFYKNYHEIFYKKTYSCYKINEIKTFENDKYVIKLLYSIIIDLQIYPFKDELDYSILFN